MENNNKYNGWSNYATWRINLELFSDVDFADEVLESENNSWRPDVDYLKELMEIWVFDRAENMGLMEDYARAFVDQVNFHEILEHILENIVKNVLQKKLKKHMTFGSIIMSKKENIKTLDLKVVICLIMSYLNYLYQNKAK